MAEKRMFSNKVIGSDAFLEMPDSTQNLYFHLSMYADDDGFVDKYRTIMRMTGKKEDDLKLLIAKSFIIPFQSGVIVIRHWRVNNYLRSDRYNETQYLNEKSLLTIQQNGEYTIGIPLVSTDKNRIDKNSIDKNRKSIVGNIPTNVQSPNFHIEIFDYWNSKNIIQHKELTEKFDKAITKALKTYSVEQVKEYIDRYNTVIKDQNFYFDTKWSLDLFLTQKNAISNFTDDGIKWINYLDKVKKQTISNKKPATREYDEQQLNSLFDDISTIEV